MADISKMRFPEVTEDLNIKDSTARELAVNAVSASIGYTDQEINNLKEFEDEALDEHIENASVHLSSSERTLLNNLDPHLQNTDIHITSAERAHWNELDEKVVNSVRASIGYVDQEVNKLNNTISTLATKAEFNDLVDDFTEHIEDTDIHITSEERALWNSFEERIVNAVRASIGYTDQETAKIESNKLIVSDTNDPTRHYRIIVTDGVLTVEEIV